MRLTLLFLICLGLLLPLASKSAKLYLRDGSVLRGNLIASSEDSIFFRTSFKGRVAFAKQDVLKIELSDSLSPAPEGERAVFAVAEPGSLQVLFHKENVSSKIVVHRDREKDACMQANSIEQALYVDNELVFSCSDSIPDKTIRNGPETIYKNTMELRDIKIALASGPHSCRIEIGNTGRKKFPERFDEKPLHETLELGNILIYPGKTTSISIDVKKRKWGFGRMELRVAE